MAADGTELEYALSSSYGFFPLLGHALVLPQSACAVEEQDHFLVARGLIEIYYQWICH